MEILSHCKMDTNEIVLTQFITISFLEQQFNKIKLLLCHSYIELMFSGGLNDFEVYFEVKFEYD